MLNKEQYAKCFLIGGLFIGILSGTPGLAAGNCFCCMWVILGGLLSGYLLCRWARYPVSEGEGALVGLISGGIGALIDTVFGALQWLFMGSEQITTAFEEIKRHQQFSLPPGSEELMQRVIEILSNPALMVSFQLVASLLIFCTLAPAGAFLAVTIWGKRGRPMPPPADPRFGPGIYIPPPMAPRTGPGASPGPSQPPGAGQDDSGFFFPR